MANNAKDILTAVRSGDEDTAAPAFKEAMTALTQTALAARKIELSSTVFDKKD
tara:strand:- start:633 stop:791 length:159 start_codon:yes stop_codon:yes gene_type:complete